MPFYNTAAFDSDSDEMPIRLLGWSLLPLSDGLVNIAGTRPASPTAGGLPAAGYKCINYIYIYGFVYMRSN